jgi:hypothetical protein
MPQIEGQLTVMLNRQKVNASPPNEAEYDVVVDGKLPEIVAGMNYASKAIHHDLRLGRSNAMGQKGTTRLREARQCREMSSKIRDKSRSKAGRSSVSKKDWMSSKFAAKFSVNSSLALAAIASL